MPLLISLALLALLAVTNAPGEGRAASEPRSPQVEPHDFTAQGLQCKSCHKTVVLRKSGSMQKTIGELCAACHRQTRHSSHPVDMKPSFALPADLPLDERGLMTCSTCHDPHRQYLNALTGEKTLYLRRDGARKKFCLACHGKQKRPKSASGETPKRMPGDADIWGR